MKIGGVLVSVAIAAILWAPGPTRADDISAPPPDGTGSPYFVGYSYPGQVNCTSGGLCVITVTAPDGIQNGDVLIVDLQATSKLKKAYPVPDELPDGWATLGMNKNKKKTAIYSNNGGSRKFTDYILAYVVGSGSNDTGAYEIGFSQINDSSTSLNAFLVAYRAASSDLSSYLAYAYPVNYVNSYSTTTSRKVTTVNATLLTLFSGNPNKADPNAQCVKYGPISGSPTLTEETPHNPCADDPVDHELFAADIAVPAAPKSFGGYSSLINGGNNGYGGANYAFQVIIPPQ